MTSNVFSYKPMLKKITEFTGSFVPILSKGHKLASDALCAKALSPVLQEIFQVESLGFSMREIGEMVLRLKNQVSNLEYQAIRKKFLNPFNPEWIFSLYMSAEKYNEALLVLWKALQYTLPFPPQLESTQAIREWMNDPKNEKDLDGVEILHLPSRELQVIPKELRKCKRLSSADFSFNSIKEVPEWIIKLPNLENLELNHNLIEKVPEELTQKTGLQIDLNDNPLKRPEGKMQESKFNFDW